MTDRKAKRCSMQKGNFSLNSVSFALVGLMSALHFQAQAQAQSAAGAETQLDRVEVTSGKRKQLQTEVAGTVSVVDGARLERLGSTDLEDVMKLTPGVQFNKGSADNSLLSIRGVSTNSSALNQGFTQAPTGIYIEDVPFTDPFAFVSVPDLAPFDLERVEVLRGPQGALYGSSSLGGAIRYLVNKPNLKSMEGSVLATYQQTNGNSGWSTSVMANAPLVDGKAGLRVVLNKRQDPGFIDNMGTGVSGANTVGVDGGRVIFTYKPDQNFDLTALYLKQRSEQSDGSGISSFDYASGKGYNNFYDQLKVKTAVPQRFQSSFDLGSIQANLNLGSLRLTSLTGYQTKQRLAREDFSRDFYDPAFIGDKWTSDTDLNTRAVSQEIRLAPVTAGSINWLVGAFWMNSTVRRDQKVFLEPRGATPDIRLRRNGEAVESAVFADAEVKLSKNWIGDVGIRFYRTNLQYDRIVGATDPGTSTPYSSSDTGNTPKVSLRYLVDQDLSFYALASRGYRFGGISNLGSSPVGVPYKSDSLMNYEAGMRWLPSKDSSVDVSVFHIDWKDVQLSGLYTDPATGRQFLVTGNIGQAVSDGVELSAAWRPLSPLSLRAAVAYTKATTSAGLTIGGTPIPSGTRLPGTAELQGTLDATLNFDGPLESSGRFSTVYSYTGERKAQIDSGIVLPGYSTLDMRLAFSWSQFEVAAFVNNVADSRGVSAAVDYFSTYSEFYPVRPRTAGVSVRYDF